MTFREIASLIDSMGFPAAYYQFPARTGIAPPFICFYYPNNMDMKADDSNYQKIEHLIIELYTDKKDFEAEAAVEAVLAQNEMVWRRTETGIDSERMYEVVYELDVIITEDLANG